jgi:hypothetical protein
MRVWIVWRVASPRLPDMQKVELITASRERALETAAASVLLRAEEHEVEDAP